MPRQKRLDVAGSIYHALNRGNARQGIFHKDEDYLALIRVLGEGLQRYPVRLFAFTLMPNHWHLVLSPEEDGMMGRMLRWVTAPILSVITRTTTLPVKVICTSLVSRVFRSRVTSIF